MSAIALTPRHGAARWWTSYRHMLWFELASQRQWLPFMLIIQILLSAGMAVLYGFYLPAIPPQLAAYIVTGTPALALIPIGLMSLPNVIVNRRIAGNYDFVRSLPVPRSTEVAATATVFTLLAIPGMVIAVWLASWRYGVTLHVSPLIGPAVLLTSLMATSVGAALGHGIANPMLINLVGNLLAFAVLLFTPVVFPPAQYPAWLVHLHEVLPFYNMAVVLRDALSTGLVAHVGRSYAILAGWSAAGLGVTGWIISRRG
jgi:ABC-2 type transport system permease protein